MDTTPGGRTRMMTALPTSEMSFQKKVWIGGGLVR